MPNWECCDYDITDTRDNISLLAHEFEQAKKHNAENDFGENWMGNLMVHIGYPYKDVCKRANGCPNARGEIVGFSIHNNDNTGMSTLSIQTETAWSPLHDCIVQFCRFFLPDCEIESYYLVEQYEVL